MSALKPLGTSVLVTGVAGFIGSHVAAHCLRLGFHVTGVDDLSGGFRDNVPAAVEFLHGDVSDAQFVASLWNGRDFDYVYHLAAYAAEGLSHFIRHYNYRTNLVSSVLLINQAVLRRVKCFVFTSSIAVYGEGQTPMSEDTTPRPSDPYGISKYAVELDLEAAHRMFGLNYIVFRPHNVYGEHQNIADRYRNVIGIFMNQLMRGEPMTIFGDGMQTRAFTYIDDVAPVIARAPLTPDAYQQVFNIGADEPYTVKELAGEVSRVLGRPCSIKYLPPRQEALHAFATHEKLLRIFAQSEQVGLSDGLARMAAWAKSRGPMEPVRFDSIEIPIGLPEGWKPAIRARTSNDHVGD
jgi:UDP-glucose 4-epimerase